jgi:hypothetical protein
MGKWLAPLLLLLLLSLAAAPAGAVRFMDVGTTLNVPATVCAAWGDYDDDGCPDLYIGGIWGGHRAYLLHNNGNGTFTDVTVAMGLHLDGASWEDMQAAWADFNNDGTMDLLVVGGSTHLPFLYRNDGDHFTDIGGAAAGFSSQWYVGAGGAWGDYDGDNWLDLYVTNNYWSAPSFLYHNNRDGTFTEVTSAAGMDLAPAGYAQGCAWADYNNDGLLDLIVARTQDAYGTQQTPRLYRNDGDGTFTDVALAAGIPGSSLESVAVGDYDNDGFLDIYFGGNLNRGTILVHNNGDGTFTNVHDTAMTIGANSVGTAWADYDNDGFVDLAQGNFTLPDYPWPGNAFLFHNNQDGSFDEVSAAEGITASRKFHATAWADFNRDGRMDVLLAGVDSYSCLYQNTAVAGDGHWLRVRALTSATGDATDGSPVRDAIGARVDVNLDNDLSFPTGRTLARIIDGGSGFLSQGEPIAQFGLGNATTVAVRVVFPDHSIITQADVAANQQIEVRDTYQGLGSIEGTVTDARNGNPVIGGTVTCSYLTAMTNVSGVYRLPVVPTGTYSVTATGPGFATVTVDDVVVAADATTIVDFALPLPPGTIQGIVKDSSTASPISGATVTCASESATTGADGAYSLTLGPGTYDVSASAPGYHSRTVEDVVVTSGETTTLDLPLVRVTGTIAGTVTNALTHAGVAGATVQCGSASAVADGTGHYQLAVPPGADLSVTVTADDYYGRAVDGVTVTGGETTALDIALAPRTGTITYRVKAFIDSRDDLVIQGGSLKWHHLDGAAPGLWNGHNDPTTLWSTLNGTTVMDGVAWTPVWPNPYPDENRFETDSSVFTSLAPALPGIAMTAVISATDGPMPVTITQAPTAANEYTLIVHFQDDVSDAHWYDVQISVTYQGPFTDVATDHWAGDQIAACVAAGIVQGYWDGTYRPTLSVTRDQMAVYMGRAIAGGDEGVQVPTGLAEPSFTDVDEDYWAYRYIEYCAAQNVVQGYWDGSYRPTVEVNRGQMAIYVARAMVAPSGDAGVPAPAAGHQSFTDVSAENEWSWCYQHVEYLAGADIVQGYWDNTYHPERVVTRDQMAVYVARAFALPM